MITIFAVEHGAYIVAADVDAHDGRGFVEFGPVERAKRFDDVGAALAFWKQQSTVRPLRDDGKPNRPISALTVEMRTEPEGEP